MTEKTTIEIFISMNEDSDYEVGTTADDAGERLSDNSGGYMRRMVRLMVNMAPPQVTEGGQVEVTDEAGETIEVEAV